MVRKLNRFLLGVILVFCLLIVSVIYVVNAGTPWERYAFRKEVTAYMSDKYPQIDVYEQKTSHSFKSGKFGSSIQLPNGTRFDVEKSDDQELYDSYLQVQLQNELQQKVTQQVAAVNLQGDVDVDIMRTDVAFVLSDLPIEPVPSYASVSKRLADSTRIRITLHSTDEKTTLYQKVFHIVNFLNQEHLSAQFVVLMQNQAGLSIPYDKLDSITKWQDLESYLE